MPELPDSPVQSLSRHLRQQLHLHGRRRAAQTPFLLAVWQFTPREDRATVLARLAWHARHSRNAVLAAPADQAERLAKQLRRDARRCDTGQDVTVAAAFDADWQTQLEAALVLLADCPDRRAALPVEVAEPEDTP
ncbi:hypothetical protein JW613_11220 [Streptomyces smyrnaeus]|uniref:Uncharacterized protein n=1 Tax=Streptomyces smyrnaeus TaxID=1387713 RepID=A0ABS3XTY7_9ACTN|nr:hypothetical protein [Streptomyces smyrnaeus]MBO8198873.1 hypothetical protein [Streptomyces smyrnaeus]